MKKSLLLLAAVPFSTFCLHFILSALIGRNPYREHTDPEMRMTAAQIIEHYGYPSETHSLRTRDGYLLKIHRIPSTSLRQRRPLLVVHGLFSASAEWLLNFPNQSLGFILSDAGYDVWLLNLRGNRYSRGHAHFESNDSRFWEFSWDDMSEHDIPVAIDYVLKMTNQKSVYCVAYSMGTTATFGMLASKPEYNEKIKMLFAMAPAVLFEHIAGMAPSIAYVSNFLKDCCVSNRFFPELMAAIRNYLFSLSRGSWAWICHFVLYSIHGTDYGHMNTSRYPIYLYHFPERTSIHVISHFHQVAKSKTFARYDWGAAKNFIKYGQVSPPVYNLSRVTVPVNLLFSRDDVFSNYAHATRLAALLPNCVGLFGVPLDGFTHPAFVLGTDAASVIYSKVLRLLDEDEIYGDRTTSQHYVDDMSNDDNKGLCAKMAAQKRFPASTDVFVDSKR